MNDNTLSSPKKGHINRFSYLLQSNQFLSPPQATKQFAKFQLDVCLSNPCRNERSQHELVQQPIDQPKRKPAKLQLQSMNFDLFKQKIQQKSSMNSFLAYTPSKDSQKQYFNLSNHDISTIQCTNTRNKQIQTQRCNNINLTVLENSEQRNHSGIYIPKYQGEFSSISNSVQQDTKSINQQLNDFIRLELSDSDESSFELNMPTKQHKNMTNKHSRTMTEQFETWGKKQNVHSTAQKSARLPTLQSSLINTKHSKDTSIKPDFSRQNFIHQTSTFKKTSTQATAIVKTKQMSNKLLQSSSLQFQNSVSLIQTNFQPISQQNIPRSIKLGGKNSKKG